MIRIITIEREYGSGAPEIARSVARELGWKLWDQKLTTEIARLANCHVSAVEEREERPDSLYHRLLKSFARGSYEASMTVDPPQLEMLQSLDADAIVRISKKVVEQAAAEGNCVMVGRGSQHFLQDRQDTMRFFLYAPREDKIRRLVREGAQQREATSLIDSVDRERAAFIKTYFHVEWPNRPVYHAMFNTASGQDAVVRAILGFVRAVPAKAA
ncbi:MAG TPA: cytidylate kinase-like family protein [Candidatus Limnocylindrales bacterium]|nr:cytidylate kinase-like family protein [Candidatus Limnocylindrales bacterium]